MPSEGVEGLNMRIVTKSYHYMAKHFLVFLLGFGLWLEFNYFKFGSARVASFSAGILVLAAVNYMLRRKSPVYLVDYSCYRPPEEQRVPFSTFMEHSKLSGIFDETSLEFQRKILERSGLGQATYLPDAMHRLPPKPTMDFAREEARQVMFGALNKLLRKTLLNTSDIGILIVNCSLFNPTPSLASMVVNKFNLRKDILSYNLGGMGCSAGVIAVNLAESLLHVHLNTYAVIITLENITQNWYFGNQRDMLIPNCLFRVGGAAVLLSGKKKDKKRAKYQLVHTVRTHKAADDEAFYCVHQKQDEKNNMGVSLSKILMAIAGDALKTNITTLGPLVLPISEQFLFFVNLTLRKLSNHKVNLYIPDFKLAFDHFCIHAGGRAVIDELEKNLNLLPKHVEASRMSLHRFGNTSSSSIWYELSYLESKGRIRKGERIWQIAFGSGFKCNSAVWHVLQDIVPQPDSPWADCIHKYPVFIPEVTSST